MLNKKQILDALRQRFEQIAQILDQSEPTQFKQPNGEKWSNAEIIQHLVLTNASAASILKYDKPVLLERFGKPEGHPKSFSELETIVQTAFNTPVKAPERYTPQLGAEDTAESIKANWMMVLQKFADRLDSWTEEDLDDCGVPHRMLGMMTVREQLYFAILHTDHHLKQIQVS